MSRQAKQPTTNYLWPFLVVAYIALVIAGTVFPWPVASSHLATVGPGPYVPLTYSSLSSDTRDYRSQIFLVPSQIGRSWSTYRIKENNGVVAIEEIRWGILYAGCGFVVLIVAAVSWVHRKLRARRPPEAQG